MKTAAVVCALFLSGCGAFDDSGPTTGTIRIVSNASTEVVDVRIREVTGYPDGLMQLGPDQADVDAMPIGMSMEYDLKPATYYIFIKSLAGFWVTDSGTNIQLTAGSHWTVEYTYTGGQISQER
jgi:hypothetical protein